MKLKPIIDALTLPIRLPEIIADKLKPKLDVLASDKSLARRMFWCDAGRMVFGCAAVLAAVGTGILGIGMFLGYAGFGAVVPALTLLAATGVTATGAIICDKVHLECLVVKTMNKVVDEMSAKAALEEACVKTPDIKSPDFNHVAATTLGKDIQAMPAIKLARRSVSP